MEKDLKMKGFDYNIAASVFYITVSTLTHSQSTSQLTRLSQYCAFEIPVCTHLLRTRPNKTNQL